MLEIKAKLVCKQKVRQQLPRFNEYMYIQQQITRFDCDPLTQIFQFQFHRGEFIYSFFGFANKKSINLQREKYESVFWLIYKRKFVH